jgi:response regulator RpfG family c-di-GMP phosphodiesterase
MAGSPPKALPSILLVDDEAKLLDSLGQELRESFRVYTAGSVAEAEVLLAARSYDAIVSDHMLPGEQGLDFLIRVQEMMPKTRRILVTGYTNPEFISRSVAVADLTACFLKPVRASEIRDAILSAPAS